MEKKISLDVAADYNSGDSLSFAGLICIQDQLSKLKSGSVPNPSPKTSDTSQVQKQDTEFEFGNATPVLAATEPNKNFPIPADLLLFNNLHPQAFQSQENHSQVANGTNHYHSSTVTCVSSKVTNKNTSVYQNGAAKKPTTTEARIQANKKRTTSNPSFVRRVFSSLVSPCRECQATEPSIKENIMPGKSLKSY